MLHLFPSREVAIALGPIAIHWYGLLYLLAFVVGTRILPRLEHYRSLALSDDQRNSLFIHMLLGVLIGGRVGYVLFYGLESYLSDPLEILAVWHGGMSSHGGIIGVVLALVRFSRSQGIPFFVLSDTLMVPVAIGLALGRLGNFINGELYGTVTTLPWGMTFPGVEGLRHPTQLYAIGKDLFIALLCYLHLMHSSRATGAGGTSALFLILYGMLRFALEFLRDQQFPLIDIGFLSLSRGQLLTIPVVLAGILIWVNASRRTSASPAGSSVPLG